MKSWLLKNELEAIRVRESYAQLMVVQILLEME
jgi:hypothetical protein